MRIFCTINLIIALIAVAIWFNACKKTNDSQTAAINFTIPPGFPAPQYSFDLNPLTEQGFQLGRKLFYDGKLSKDGNFPCASCHHLSLRLPIMIMI
jgi:cytochrome c peroxidase